MKSNLFWIIVLTILIAFSVTTMLFFRQTGGETAKIYVNGHLTEYIDLIMVIEPYTIETKFGIGTNTVEVQHGRIRVTQANCFDGSCIRQGWNSGSRTPIVCLPNRLVIIVEADSDIDAVVGKVKDLSFTW